MLISEKGSRTDAADKIRLCVPRFGKRVVEDIEYLFGSGMIREGNVTRVFEDCFKKRVGALYGVGVSSGTAALQLALQSCTGPSAKVLVPAFTFIATASAVIHAGCEPVFVDVDPESFLMDVDDAWEKVDEGTTAVVPVHLFGNVVGYDDLLELCEENNLCIVHDCAQAIGSTINGVELGELDDICCYSFYPSKIITTGEGGMITTNNEEYASRCNLLKNHGESGKYHHTLLGYNFRTNEISSIIGLDQMTRLKESLERRRSIAKYYDLVIGNIEGIKPQSIAPEVNSCYNYYTVQVEPDVEISRDQILKDLGAMNIETAVHYPYALTEQPALRKYVHEACVEAESLSKRVFSIPIHPFLSERDMEYVASALRSIVNRYL